MTATLTLVLRRIGLRVRERRKSVGLSQERLARLSGLSRATINQLETGTLVELGVNKLAFLLGLLGLRLEAGPQVSRRRALWMASRTASVSYKTPLDVAELAKALASGDLPESLLPHVSTLLDEAPLSLLVSAVEDAARLGRVPPRRIWRHLVRWAGELHSPRAAWA